MKEQRVLRQGDIVYRGHQLWKGTVHYMNTQDDELYKHSIRSMQRPGVVISVEESPSQFIVVRWLDSYSLTRVDKSQLGFYEPQYWSFNMHYLEDTGEYL